MRIYIGADHKGFLLKKEIIDFFSQVGYEIEDCGNTVFDKNDDYPVFALAVAQKVGENPSQDRGIVLCGSGIGVDVVANKVSDVRSGLCSSVEQAYTARKDDDINILALGADFLDKDTALEVVKTFLGTPFDQGKNHQRRIDQIDTKEKE